MQKHREEITSVAFNADGKILASGSMDDTIILWDVTTQKPIKSPLKKHNSYVTSIAFNPSDSKILASGSTDKTIILWNITTQQPIGLPLQKHNDRVVSVAFNPDGKTLASGSVDKTIILWDITTQQPIGSPLQGHGYPVSSVTFSADGKILASRSKSISGNDNIILWDVTQHQQIGTVLREEEHEQIAEHYREEPHRRISLSSESGGLVKKSVTFSPNGNVLASSSKGGHLILWDVPTRQPIELPLHWYHFVDRQRARYNSFFTPLRQHEERETAHYKVTTNAIFTTDGRRLITSSQGRRTILWNVRGGFEQFIGSLEGYHVTFTPSGEILASVSENNSIILRDVETREPIGSPLQGHSDAIESIAFSPDGKILASGSADKSIILWDVKTQKPIGSPLQGHSNAIESIAFSPNGEMLASGSADKSIILWNVKTQQPIGSPLRGHSHFVTGVSFDASGKVLASGSTDNTIILWDIATQRPIGLPLQGHYEPIDSVTFSPDGKILASGSGRDNNVILWDVDPQSWYQKACNIAGRNFTQEEWHRYFPEESYEKTCSEYPSGKAIALIIEGEQLAEKAELRDIETAITKFNEAFTLDPMLREHPFYGFNPEIKAKKIAVPTVISKGESLAEEAKLDEAIATFKRAKELDASLNFDPQQKANQLVAPVLVSKGESLAQEGKIDEAIANFKHAQELDANVEISTDSWHTLCRHGSLAGQAAKVLEFCETAVKLTNEQDAEIRDHRGLARALTGDFKGAIADFQFFVQHTDSEEDKKQRQSWIKELKKGKNPITEEVLESLKP